MIIYQSLHVQCPHTVALTQRLQLGERSFEQRSPEVNLFCGLYSVFVQRSPTTPGSGTAAL